MCQICLMIDKSIPTLTELNKAFSENSVSDEHRNEILDAIYARSTDAQRAKFVGQSILDDLKSSIGDFDVSEIKVSYGMPKESK